jgi:hypothetical protein
MERRTFLGVSAAAVAMGGVSAEAQEQKPDQYYELRTTSITSGDQKGAFNTFMADAAIPALNRLKIMPVGVFEGEKETDPVYLLLPHESLESCFSSTRNLLADSEFISKGEALAGALAVSPGGNHYDTSLMRAFSSMPRMETPASGPNRVIQLRIYESPSVSAGQKKIEMFNTKEIGIFRKTGLTPVFFGETLAGTKMPNLTYMLAFNSPEEQKAAWDKFRQDPEWLALKAIPEYEDKKIVSAVTNLILKPLPCSQI